MKKAVLCLAFVLFPALAFSQGFEFEVGEVSLGGGAMIGDNGIVASWDSAFAAIQWRGVKLADEAFVTGVGIEFHPAAVLKFTEGNVRITQIDSVDFRIWSLNRLKMSTLQIPGEVWDMMFIGTDLLLHEEGSTDYTGDFTARLVYGVQEKAGPGFIDLEIYMFEKYRPVSFSVFYRYAF